jgi:hypothetical protein
MTSSSTAARERQMVQLDCVAQREQIVDTMVDLTRLSTLHRVIVTGTDSMELYLALRRRGFIRVATITTCRLPMGQHSVGLIIGQNTLRAVEAALAQVSQYLSASATIAVLVDSREGGFCLKIRARLEQMGFRIEAGVRCQQGLVLSAYRRASAGWKTQRKIP